MSDVNNISNRTVLRILAIITAFVALVLLAYSLRTVLAWVVAAFFLAVALNPAVVAAAKLMPGRKRGLATGLVFLITVSFIVMMAYVLVPPFISQTRDFVQNLPEIADTVRRSDNPVAQFVTSSGLLEQLTGADRSVALSRLSGLGGSLVDVIGNIFGGLIAMLTILALTFFMLLEGPSWIERFWMFHPKDKRAERQQLAGRMYHIVTGYVTGRLFMGLTVAISTFIILMIMGVPYALPLSILAGVLDLIPLVGATTGGVIVTLAALFQSLGAALVVAAFYLLYQQFENNVLQPLVDSRTVQLSPLSVLISAILGISVAGLLGGLIAIPVGACLQVMAKHYLKKRYNY